MSVLLLLALTAEAPCILWTGIPEYSAFAVECVGDVNGNGTEDLVAIVQTDSGSTLWCLDGRSSQVLWTRSGLPHITYRDCVATTPSLDADMTMDVILGGSDNLPPAQGRILALSGEDGQTIWEILTDHLSTVAAVAWSPAPPDEVPVVHASVKVGDFRYFLSFDGIDGHALWEVAHATADAGIHTIEDFSGNGWGEMGYSVDRGSAYSGFCRVHDGRTGTQLYNVSSWYYGRMDLTDYPEPLIAVGQWGGFGADLRLLSVPAGNELYGLSEYQVIYDQVKFVRGVEGGPLPFPVLLGWSGSEMNLVCGLGGAVSETYDYTGSIIEIEGCPFPEGLWKLAVLTTGFFYLSEPEEYFVSPGDSCSLPASGQDLCLLNSDQFPTPLAAVVLSGTPGVCVLVTSWPEGIEEAEPQVEYPLRLLGNPARDGLHLFLEDGFQGASVLDVRGRVVARIPTGPIGEIDLSVLPGVYFIIADGVDSTPVRAVVLTCP